MREPSRTAVQLSTGLVVLAGYLALANVRGYGSAVVLLPVSYLLLGPAGVWLQARIPLYRAATNAVTIVFLAVNPFIVATAGKLDWLMLFAAYIQLYLCVHRMSSRDFYYMILMAFIHLLGACVQSPEPAIALVLLLFLFASIWAFLTLRILVEQEQNPISVPPEIVPLREGGLPVESRPAFDFGMFLSVAAVGMIAILVTAVFFFFTPRIEAGFLGRDESSISTTGLTQTVDLTGGAYVQEDQTAVMRVEFPSEPGGAFSAGQMYWRSTTMPNFFRAQWTRRGLNNHLEPRIPDLFQEGVFRRFRANPLELVRAGRPGTRMVHQVIYMDDVPEEGVPCLDLVQKIEVVGHVKNTVLNWDGKRDFSVALSTNGPRRLTYEVWSEVGDPPPDVLRAASQDYSFIDPEDFALLTNHDLTPETLELARRLTANEATVYDKAAVLRSWLSGENFSYTLNLPPLPGENPIDFFINEARTGHCELFASALALMLRGLDVPTRVVSGYRGGEWNDSDGSYIIRASMAHLWVEVLFPEYGWVVFDPSPRDEGGDATGFRGIVAMLSSYGLRAKMLWYQQVVGYERSIRLSQIRDFSIGLIRSWSFSDDIGRGAARAFLPSLAYPALFLFAAGTLLVAGAMWFRRRAEERRYWDTGQRLNADQRRAVRLYLALRGRLTRLGVSCTGRTAEDLLQDVTFATLKDDGPALDALRIYNSVRFGKRPLGRADFRAAVRALKRLRLDDPAHRGRITGSKLSAG